MEGNPFCPTKNFGLKATKTSLLDVYLICALESCKSHSCGGEAHLVELSSIDRAES